MPCTSSPAVENLFGSGNHNNWGAEFQQYLLDPADGTEPEDFRQYHQHSVEITADGNIILFDNGNNKASPYTDEIPVPSEENWSRAVIYAIDEDDMTVEQLWEYDADKQLYAGFISDADQLTETGNILADFGGISYVNGVLGAELGKGQTHTRIIEVTREG